MNIQSVLQKELKRYRKGIIGIGTVTDPYQDVEKEYSLTRKCLETIVAYDFPISIQTKSSLVTRDIDILKKFTSCEVGFTITTSHDDERKKYEGGSDIPDRLNALKVLKDNGIGTWAFIGPILPGITDKDDDLRYILGQLKSVKVEYVLVDRLRIKPGLWEKIKSFIINEHPELLATYENIFQRNGLSSYYSKVFSDLRGLAKEYKIELRMAFD